MTYPHNGILLGSNKEQRADSCFNTLTSSTHKLFHSLKKKKYKNLKILSSITWLCGVDAEFPVEGLTFEVLLRAFFCCKAMVYLLTAFRYSLSWKRESAWYTKSWYFWDAESNSLENKSILYMGYREMLEHLNVHITPEQRLI